MTSNCSFVDCPVCHGTGTGISGDNCLECVGSGRVSKEAARMLNRTLQPGKTFRHRRIPEAENK